MSTDFILRMLKQYRSPIYLFLLLLFVVGVAILTSFMILSQNNYVVPPPAHQDRKNNELNKASSTNASLDPSSISCGLRGMSPDYIAYNPQYPTMKIDRVEVWPWVVYITRRKTMYRQSTGCSGVLISDNWVLTSAKCLMGAEAKDIRIYYGSTDKPARNAILRFISWRRNIKAEELITHPLYETSRPILYDIGLIKLKSAVTISRKAQPVCLPDNLDKEDEIEEKICYILGFTKEFTTMTSWRVDIVVYSNMLYGNAHWKSYACPNSTGTGLACWIERKNIWVAMGTLVFTDNKPESCYSLFSSNVYYRNWIYTITEL